MTPTSATPARPSRALQRLFATPNLFAAAGLLLVAGLLLTFLYAPTDASSMGFSQKIFFFHVPIAESALVCYFVALVAGVLYLRSNDLKYDRLGLVSVRLGLLFSLLVMVTGMIWGKAAWGVWWQWEPRLTTFFIACLLYTAYFVLRQTVEEESRRATFAALFAIIAFVDVPITFFATRLAPNGLHPVNKGMPGSMLLPFFVCMAGMTLLVIALMRFEYTIETLKEDLHELKNKIGV